MNNFKLIQEHFSQLHCAYCESFFSAEGVELLREEEDYWVVRVSCSSCQQPAGVAIVGIEYEEPGVREPREKEKPAARPVSDLTARERKRFAQLNSISADDVLDAHSFIQDLGADWMRHLPKRFQPRD